MSSAVIAADFADFAAELNATWASHPVTGQATIRVLAASAGLPPPRCSRPHLVVLLAGHHRTFGHAAATWAAAAEASAPGCHLVAALLPDVYDVPDVERRVWRKNDWRPGPRALGIAASVATAQREAFSGRLAYAVVKRSGLIDKFPACLAFYWHGAFALASWAARVHGLAMDDAAIVLRSRPDVLLQRPYQLDGLRRFFASAAPAERQVLLGQQGRNLQADILLLTSWSTYRAGVIAPLQASAKAWTWARTSSSLGSTAASSPTSSVSPRASHAARTSQLAVARVLWERAHLNGWGYGQSVHDEGPPTMEPCMHACFWSARSPAALDSLAAPCLLRRPSPHGLAHFMALGAASS